MMKKIFATGGVVGRLPNVVIGDDTGELYLSPKRGLQTGKVTFPLGVGKDYASRTMDEHIVTALLKPVTRHPLLRDQKIEFRAVKHTARPALDLEGNDHKLGVPCHYQLDTRELEQAAMPDLLVHECMKKVAKKIDEKILEVLGVNQAEADVMAAQVLSGTRNPLIDHGPGRYIPGGVTYPGFNMDMQAQSRLYRNSPVQYAPYIDWGWDDIVGNARYRTAKLKDKVARTAARVKRRLELVEKLIEALNAAVERQDTHVIIGIRRDRLPKGEFVTLFGPGTPKGDILATDFIDPKVPKAGYKITARFDTHVLKCYMSENVEAIKRSAAH